MGIFLLADVVSKQKLYKMIVMESNNQQSNNTESGSGVSPIEIVKIQAKLEKMYPKSQTEIEAVVLGIKELIESEKSATYFCEPFIILKSSFIIFMFMALGQRNRLCR